MKVTDVITFILENRLFHVAGLAFLKQVVVSGWVLNVSIALSMLDMVAIMKTGLQSRQVISTT